MEGWRWFSEKVLITIVITNFSEKHRHPSILVKYYFLKNKWLFTYIINEKVFISSTWHPLTLQKIIFYCNGRMAMFFRNFLITTQRWTSWISCQDLIKILNSWIAWKVLRFYLTSWISFVRSWIYSWISWQYVGFHHGYLDKILDSIHWISSKILPDFARSWQDVGRRGKNLARSWQGLGKIFKMSNAR